MIYRGPGFLAVVRFCSSLTLVFSYPASKLSFLLSPAVCHRSSLLTRERGGRSQIIRQRESLVLCKSFYTLWLSHITVRRSKQPSPPHTPCCSKILAGNCKLSPLPLYPRGTGSWVLGGGGGGGGCKTLGLAGYEMTAG